MISLFCPARLGVLFCSVVLGSDTHLKLLDRVVSGASFLTVNVFVFNIAYRSSICSSIVCKLSGVTWCTLFIVLYFCRMWQCGLLSRIWSHIGILMLLLAAEPCIRWYGTGGLQEQDQCIDIELRCSRLFRLLVFSLSLLSSIYVRVVGLGCPYWWGVNHSLPALHCRSF